MNNIFIYLFIFFKNMSHLNKAAFIWKYYKNSNIVKCYNLKLLHSTVIYFKIVFIPVMVKLNF